MKCPPLLSAAVLLVIACFTGFGQTVPCICPIHGKTCADITGDFGPRKHPVLNIVKEHEGVDFDVPVGTPVVATARGKVAVAGPKDGYGLEVIVAHGRGYRTLYAHLSKVAVAQGAIVKQGEVIAYSGRSGLVYTPHLHYEVMKDGKNVDPKQFIHPTSH